MAKKAIDVVREISTLEMDINIMKTTLSVKKMAGTADYRQLANLLEALGDAKKMIMKNPNLE